MPIQQTDSPTDKRPLVSFIVPVFNLPEEMLRACVESVLALELEPSEREIIVVDDGSDLSPERMLSAFGKEVTYVRMANGGVSAARNEGLGRAKGRFVQFVDGDDRLLKGPYEHVLSLARKEDTDMVMFDFTHSADTQAVYEDGAILSGTQLLQSCNIHGAAWSYLFRKEAAGHLRFTKGVAYGEDEEFTVGLLLRVGRVRQTSAQAYYYRERPSSAIHALDERRRQQRLEDNYGVIMRLKELLDTLPAHQQGALERRVAQLTMDYIYNIIMLNDSRSYLHQQIDRLREKGLFPLPRRSYTTKYTWFRRMTNTEIGRRLLCWLLPMTKKER